ncbi:hypothetical protein Taro_023089 [Colocasia esculenta]|uniref:Uncharacterized protein n=1 Tax=Colocasia esculenta TaxID=4460 RepID=A0A843V3Q7_COLES|nr:hypothetical protein [Colocasia esculenta]
MTKTNTGQLWGEPPPKAPRDVLGEPHQNAAQPNDTLQTTGATQQTAEATQAGSGRTSTRTTKAQIWENPPECTNQNNNIPQTLK